MHPPVDKSPIRPVEKPVLSQTVTTRATNKPYRLETLEQIEAQTCLWSQNAACKLRTEGAPWSQRNLIQAQQKTRTALPQL